MPVRIGIDVHQVGARQTGNERYIVGLVDAMLDLAPEEVDLRLYHTGAALPARWSGAARRIRPHHRLLRIGLSMPLALGRDGVDVAHFQYVVPPVCPAALVTTIHDVSFERLPQCFHPLMARRMKLLTPLAARRSRHVLTVSEFSKREIVALYGIPPEHITVTYNGVAGCFRPMSAEEVGRHTAPLGLRKPFILAVGNLQPRKNIPHLIRAYARARRVHGLEHALVLAGQAGYRGSAVVAEVERSGLAAHVTWTGYVPEETLAALYNEADFFVYPSLYEGFGLPLVEAMACGTPVLCGRHAVFEEVAGDAACYVDPRSLAELAGALVTLASDGALRREMRRRGLARAKCFTWTEAARRTLAVYQAVGRGERPRAEARAERAAVGG